MKIVIIGAGSAFGGRIAVDVLSRDPLQESTIALVDIDEGRLKIVSSALTNQHRESWNRGSLAHPIDSAPMS